MKIFNKYKSDKKILYGLFWVFVSVLSGTMMYILAKDLLATQTQADCCYWWFAFAVIFYSIYYTFSEKTFKSTNLKRYFGWIALFIVLQISSTVLFFAGLRLIDPSISSFLQRSQVVFILILAMVMLGERFSKGEWSSSFLIITGLVLITFNTSEISFIGSILILSSTFLASMSIIIVRKISYHIGSHTFAFIRTITLFLFYLLYASSVPGSFGLLPTKSMITIMAGALFGPFLTVISSYKALEYMEASKVALFSTIQPFFVMISSFLLFGSYPGLKGIIGGVLMVVGNIVFIQMNVKKSKVQIVANMPCEE